MSSAADVLYTCGTVSSSAFHQGMLRTLQTKIAGGKSQIMWNAQYGTSDRRGRPSPAPVHMHSRVRATADGWMHKHMACDAQIALMAGGGLAGVR